MKTNKRIIEFDATAKLTPVNVNYLLDSRGCLTGAVVTAYGLINSKCINLKTIYMESVRCLSIIAVAVLAQT